jgi:hypothetical protein
MQVTGGVAELSSELVSLARRLSVHAPQLTGEFFRIRLRRVKVKARGSEGDSLQRTHGRSIRRCAGIDSSVDVGYIRKQAFDAGSPRQKLSRQGTLVIVAVTMWDRFYAPAHHKERLMGERG